MNMDIKKFTTYEFELNEERRSIKLLDPAYVQRVEEEFKKRNISYWIDKKDIGAAWSGTCYEETNIGKSSITLSVALKLPFVGSTRVENWCATGTEALRGASYAVAAGAYDICLACGVEKLKDTGYGGLPQTDSQVGTSYRFIFPNYTPPGMFAMMGTRYFAQYGLSPEEGKRVLAHITVKSHHNGAMNPKAHLRREVTIDDVVNAPIVAWGPFHGSLRGLWMRREA
jgi:acetyl-CoA C-acetyltransferase